jgi:hypothetical protein
MSQLRGLVMDRPQDKSQYGGQERGLSKKMQQHQAYSVRSHSSEGGYE